MTPRCPPGSASPYRQNATALERSQDLIQVAALRATDEQDVAVADLRHTAVALDDQGSLIDHLPANDFVELRTERVLAENTDDERRVGAREGLGRPVDKLGEIEEKDRLDLILRRPGDARERPR
jgi:hypothetical protein